MATMPPGPPPPPGNLPAMPQGGPGPTGAGGQDQAGMMTGAMPPAGGVPQQMLQTMVDVGQQVDQLLGMIADAAGPEGGQEIAKARELVQAGIGKFLAKFGVGPGSVAAPAGAPPSSGFPGGGFTSV